MLYVYSLNRCTVNHPPTCNVLHFLAQGLILHIEGTCYGLGAVFPPWTHVRNQMSSVAVVGDDVELLDVLPHGECTGRWGAASAGLKISCGAFGSHQASGAGLTLPSVTGSHKRLPLWHYPSRASPEVEPVGRITWSWALNLQNCKLDKTVFFAKLACLGSFLTGTENRAAHHLMKITWSYSFSHLNQQVFIGHL